MTRENVLAGTQQFKLPLKLLSLLWKYEVILILQKLNVEVWVITLYRAIYFAQQPYYYLCVATYVKPKNFLWK